MTFRLRVLSDASLLKESVAFTHQPAAIAAMGVEMQIRDPISTRNRILDACEQIYADEGVEGITLRVITEKARVNLAAVNYHFGTKDILAAEILKRRLTPIHEERLGLLKTLEQARGNMMKPTHVLSAILLPVMRLIMVPDKPPYLMPLLLRCSSDPSPLMRAVMASQFESMSEAFDDAFVRSASKLDPDDVIWRSRVFFNAFPGTIANQNTLTMLQNMMRKPGTSCADVLIQFGSVLECVTHGETHHHHMRRLATDILTILADTPTVTALRGLMPLDRPGAAHEDSDTPLNRMQAGGAPV